MQITYSLWTMALIGSTSLIKNAPGEIWCDQLLGVRDCCEQHFCGGKSVISLPELIEVT